MLEKIEYRPSFLRLSIHPILSQIFTDDYGHNSPHLGRVEV